MKRYKISKAYKQANLLKKEFPEIPMCEIYSLDMKIKKKICAYTPPKLFSDTSNYIYTNIVEHYAVSKDSRKIKRKCNRIANAYLDNQRMYVIQEGWFSVLAYFITITGMVLRLINVENKIGDFANFLMYLFSIFIWLILVSSRRFMSDKAEKFINAFNQNASSLIFVGGCMWYFVLCAFDVKIIATIILICFVLGSVFITLLWYKRNCDECREIGV